MHSCTIFVQVQLHNLHTCTAAQSLYKYSCTIFVQVQSCVKVKVAILGSLNSLCGCKATLNELTYIYMQFHTEEQMYKHNVIQNVENINLYFDFFQTCDLD